MKIALIDDHNLFLEGIASLLKDRNAYKVSKFSDPIKFLEVYSDKKFDLIITDIEMPQISGLELIGRVKTIFNRQKIIVITMHKSGLLLDSMKDLGINGLLFKNSSPPEIFECIEQVNSGEKYFSTLNVDAVDTNYEKLTKREIVVIQLLVQGFTSKDIASILSISEMTINTHRRNLLKKLNLSNSNKLIKWALEQDFIY